MKIAYIVYTDNGPFSFADAEHDSLLQFVRDKGLDIHKAAWADENVDWKRYQCIVLKSPWDYVARTQQFYKWLNEIKRLDILLLNSADVVKWNSDKHYLQEIADAGLKVIPTAFLEQETTFDAHLYFEKFGAKELIVKPCISGSSKNTFKVSGAPDPVINELLKQESMMVQPFMPQINDEGEWSLVFLGGKFSHALVKTPAREDFRSQPQFGGVVRGRTPAPEVLEAATRYVTQFAKDCLYARVDGLIIEAEFYLMELELIDPYLFLSTFEGGYENYYNALSELIAKQGRPSSALLQN